MCAEIGVSITRSLIKSVPGNEHRRMTTCNCFPVPNCSILIPVTANQGVV